MEAFFEPQAENLAHKFFIRLKKDSKKIKMQACFKIATITFIKLYKIGSCIIMNAFDDGFKFPFGSQSL